MAEDAAKTVFTTFSAIFMAPRELTGDNILRVDGPLGVWRMRAASRPRGVWDKVVWPPVGSMKVHSIKKLKEVLTSEPYNFPPELFEGVDPLPLPLPAAVVDVVGNNPIVVDNLSQLVADAVRDPSPRHHMAAFKMQTMVRVSIAKRAARSQEAVRAAIVDLDAQIATLSANRAVLLAREPEDTARRARTLEAAIDSHHTETIHALLNPDVYILTPLYKHLRSDTGPQETPRKPITSYVYEQTDFNRAGLRDIATNEMRANANAPLSHAHNAPRMLLKDAHFPIILGVMPLPKGLREFTSSFGDTGYFFDTGGEITKEHTKRLAKTLGKHWAQHVAKHVVLRSVSVYDVFADRSRSVYAGSVILAKFVYGRHGKLSTAISIESIVTQDEGSHFGTVMFEFAKDNLFSDGRNVKSGIVFAQCALAQLEFWSGKMTQSFEAAALVFQLFVLYESYLYEEGTCDMRGKEFFADYDAPSPLKMMA